MTDPSYYADMCYERARAEAALERLRVAVDVLSTLEAQDSNIPGSTARADCMAALARVALRNIGEVPES